MTSFDSRRFEVGPPAKNHLRFRVTDENGWENRFDAADATSLLVGIQIGCDAYRETGLRGTTRLHLWGAVAMSPSGIWLTPGFARDARAPRVTVAVTLDECEKILIGARRMAQHHRNLIGMCDAVAEAAYPTPVRGEVS